MDWKNLKPGRERLIYALGMLNSTSDETAEATVNEVYNILSDVLKNCNIYDNPPDEDFDFHEE